MKIIATIQTFEQVGQEDYKNLHHSREYDTNATIQDIIDEMRCEVKNDVVEGNRKLSDETIFRKLIFSIKV